MKKILASILASAMMLSLAAGSGSPRSFVRGPCGR